MIPSLPPLATLEANMVGQYKRIALRNLVFFNDPHRRGRIRTADLLVRERYPRALSWLSRHDASRGHRSGSGARRQVSKQLADFLELRHEVHTAQAAARLSNNWFSLHNARRVYTCVGRPTVQRPCV